jgi:hypothetical protein
MRERAHQYRVMAERQQFHLDRQNLPTGAAHLVREESVTGQTKPPTS